MISSGFGPSLVEIKSLGIGLLETSNFDLDLNDSEFLAVGETYRFDKDTRNSLYNLLVNRDGVGINTSRRQLDGFFEQSVKKSALYVGSDIVCTGNIISNGFQFDNIKFDSVNSNILENVLQKLEDKQNVFFKGYDCIRVANYISGNSEARNTSLNNYYTTNNITIGTNSDTYLNASPLNIATTPDNNIDNIHISMTNKSSALNENDCGTIDPEVSKFRIGFIGNSENSPAVLSTTSEIPLTFHVGLTKEQVNSLYSTTSFPRYENTGITPSMTIDTSGNVLVGTVTNKDVSFIKRTKNEQDFVKSEQITKKPKMMVNGVSAFDDIVLYDYYTKQYQHLDDVYARIRGETMNADQITPGDFSAGFFRFNSNLYIGTTGSQHKLEVNNYLDVRGDLNVENSTVTKTITVTDDALFNRNIQVENTIASSICRTGEMHILRDLNIDNTRVNIQSFHPIMVDPSIANASNISGSNLLFFAYDNAINISNSNLVVPGKLTTGATKFDSTGNAQFGVFKTKYVNIEMMLKDNSMENVADVEPTMYMGHLTSLPTNNGQKDNSIVFNTNQTDGLHNMYFYPGSKIVTDTGGFETPPTLTIHQNGRVGVNNNNPQYELDVFGNVLANDIYIRTNAVANKAMFFVSKKDEFSQEGDTRKDFFYLYDINGSIDKYCINFTDIANQEDFCGKDIILKGLNVKGGIHATTGGYYHHNKEVANFIIENPDKNNNTAYINKNIVIGCDRNLQTRAPIAVKSMYDDKYNDSIMRFYRGQQIGEIQPRFSGIDICSYETIPEPLLSYQHANSNRWFIYRDHRLDKPTNSSVLGLLRFGHTYESERPNINKPDPISIVACENHRYTTHINRAMDDNDALSLEDMIDKAMVIHGDLEVKGNINVTGKYLLEGENVNISPNAIEDTANEAHDKITNSQKSNTNDVVVTGNKIALLPDKTVVIGHIDTGGFLEHVGNIGKSSTYNIPLTVYQNSTKTTKVSKFMSNTKASIEICTIHFPNMKENDLSIDSTESSANLEVFKSSDDKLGERSVFNIKGKLGGGRENNLISVYHCEGKNYTGFNVANQNSETFLKKVQNVAVHIENTVKNMLLLENTAYAPAISMKGNNNSFWKIEAPNDMDEFVLKFNENVNGSNLFQDNDKKVLVVTPNKMSINKNCPLYALDVLGEEDKSCMRITNKYSEKSITNKYSKIAVSYSKLSSNHQYQGYIDDVINANDIKIFSKGLKYFVKNEDFPIRDIYGNRIRQDFLDISNLVATQTYSNKSYHELSFTSNINDYYTINYQYITEINAPTTIFDFDNVDISCNIILNNETELTINNIVRFLKPVPDGLYAGDTFECEIEDNTFYSYTFQYEHFNVTINDIYKIYKFIEGEDHTFYLEINTIEYQPHIILQNNILFDSIHEDGSEIKNGKINKIFSKDGSFEIVTEDEINKKTILRIDDTGDTFITGELNVTNGNIKTNTIFMNDIYIKGDIYDKMGNSMTYNYSENMFDRPFIMQSSNYILHTSNYSIHVLSNLDFTIQKECTTGMNIIKEYDNYDTEYDLFRISEKDKVNDKLDLAFVISKGGQVGIQREPDCCYDLDVKLSTRSPYINSHEIVSDTIEADGSNLRNVNLSDRDTSMLKEGCNLYFTHGRVATIIDGSNVHTCNYIRYLNRNMSNYVKNLDLDQIAIGNRNTYIVNNTITNTNKSTSNELQILGNLFVTGNVTILGSNKVLTTSDQSNTSLCIAGVTKETSLKIHRSNTWNDIMNVTSQYDDEDFKNIFNIAKNGGIKVNKPIDDSDDYFKFDVEGSLRATKLYGIGENISNVNLNDKSTNFLTEGSSNLYFTSFRVAEILNASNVETCNYIRHLDSNMSNYIETTSNDIRRDMTLSSNEIRRDMTLSSNEIRRDMTLSSNQIRRDMTLSSNQIRRDMTLSSNQFRRDMTLSSNQIRRDMTLSSNEISNRITTTSNQINTQIIDIYNNLDTIILKTTNTTYAKYTFDSSSNLLKDSSVNKNDMTCNFVIQEPITNVFDLEDRRLKLLPGNIVTVPEGLLDDINIVKIKFDFELYQYQSNIFQLDYVAEGTPYTVILHNKENVVNTIDTQYIPKTHIFENDSINKFEMTLFKNFKYTTTSNQKTWDTLIYVNDKIVRLDDFEYYEQIQYFDNINDDPDIDGHRTDVKLYHIVDEIEEPKLLLFEKLDNEYIEDSDKLIFTSNLNNNYEFITKFAIKFDEATYPKGVYLKKIRVGFDFDFTDVEYRYNDANVIELGVSLNGTQLGYPVEVDPVEVGYGEDKVETKDQFEIILNKSDYLNDYIFDMNISNVQEEVKINGMVTAFPIVPRITNIQLLYQEYEYNTFGITFGDVLPDASSFSVLYLDNVEVSVQDTITLRETTMLCRDTFAENIKNCGIDQISSSTSNLVVNENITSSNINTISLNADIANISNLIVRENITSSNIDTIYLTVHENITSSNIDTISIYSDIANILNLTVEENITSSNINTISLNADIANISNLTVHENITSSNIDTISIYSDIANILNLTVEENITSSNINTISLNADIANISNLSVHEIISSNIDTVSLNADIINVSNLYVKGTTTTIYTDSYQTQNLVILEHDDGPGIQIDVKDKEAICVKNTNYDEIVFKVDKDGKIYNKDHGINGVDVIKCTSNYIKNTSNILNEKFTYANVLYYEPGEINLDRVDQFNTVYDRPFKFNNNCLKWTFDFKINETPLISDDYHLSVGKLFYKINNNITNNTISIVIKKQENGNKIGIYKDNSLVIEKQHSGVDYTNNKVYLTIVHNSFTINDQIYPSDLTLFLNINDTTFDLNINQFLVTSSGDENLKISLFNKNVSIYSNFRLEEIKQQYPVITESVLINNTSNLNPKPFMLTSNNSEVFSIGEDGRIYVQGSEYKPSEFKKKDNDIYYEKGRFYVSQSSESVPEVLRNKDYSIFTDKNIVCSNLYIKTDDNVNYIHLRSSNQNSFEVYNSSGDMIFQVDKSKDTDQVYVGDKSLSEFERKPPTDDIYYRRGKFGVSSNRDLAVDFTFPDIDRDYAFYSDGDIYCEGTIMATGDVIASYSDIRLKTKLSEIYDPIEKIMQIETFQYMASPLAQSFGINDKTHQIGVSAQSVQKILPEIVHLAPFDTKILHDRSIVSKSGSNFLTISYERLVPLLIECIKQQQKDIDFLKNKLM